MSRRDRPAHIPPVVAESARSKRYAAGRAIRYSGRIHGPTFPVTTYSIDDLPDDSILKPMVQAMYDFAHDPINEITVVDDLPDDSSLRSAESDGRMAAWFAQSGIAHKASAPTNDDLYRDLGHGESHR